MESLGLRVRRYRAKEIFENISGVIDDILFYCGEYVLKDFPQYQWCYACHLESGIKFISGIHHETLTISTIQKMKINSMAYIINLNNGNALIGKSFIFHVN
jgi:hypothetical protein